MEQTRAALTAELVRALEEALALHDAGRRRVEAAGARAERSRSDLGRMLVARRTDMDAARQMAREHAAERASLAAMREDARESGLLSARAARTYEDVRDYLMRLYAHPEVRDAAEQIAARLREIRLMPTEHGDEDELHAPEPPAKTPSSHEELQAFKTEIADRWFTWSDARFERMRARHAEQFARTRRLLTEALDMARGLAAQPPA